MQVSNASLYGVFISQVPGLTIGTEVEVSVFMSDGARVNLGGRIVAERETGLAGALGPLKTSTWLFGFI